MFDEEYPAPPGYKVWRNTIPPVYTSEQAELVKAELRRRIEIKGRTRPQDSYRFTGLFVCGECWRNMTVINTNDKR